MAAMITCHEGHRKPPTAATCMYHDLRPQTWQPQALTVVVKGPYHGGQSGSHRGPTTAAIGDLPRWPQGPTTIATRDLPQRQPTGDLPQQPRGPPTGATGDLPQWPWGTSHCSHGGPITVATGDLPQRQPQGTSHSGHGGTSHSGHGGPPTVATGDLPQWPWGPTTAATGKR